MRSKLEIRTTRPFVICPTDELRALCIEHNWFTCGSTEQYEKLFDVNRKFFETEEPGDVTCTKDVATIIWVCSNASYREILNTVAAKRDEYIQRLYAAEELSGDEEF